MVISCIEDSKCHAAFGAWVLVSLWVFFQVFVEVKE